MKKISLIALVALTPALGFAQGGSWYVGGIAGFNSTSDNSDKNPEASSWSFGPEVGTFFNAKWSAGIALGLSGDKAKNNDGDISSTSLFQPDLYVRHWCPVGDRFNIFTGLDVSFGSGKTTYYGHPDAGIPDVETKTSTFGANLNAGVTYALADRWTLLMKIAALGYSSSKTGDVTTSTFGLLADGNVIDGQFLFVGLYWTFIPAK